MSMDDVYTDLIKSWNYLKKGKQNTAFGIVKPTGKNPPWVVLDKSGKVKSSLKAGRVKGAGYKSASISFGRVERVRKRVVFITSDKGIVAKLLKTAATRLMKASKEAGSSESSAVSSKAGDIKKLAVLLRTAVVMTEDEFLTEEVEDADLEAIAAEEEEALAEDSELQAELKELQAELKELQQQPPLSEDELGQIFEEDAEEAIEAIRVSSELLQKLQRPEAEDINEDIEAVWGEVASGRISPEHIAEALVTGLSVESASSKESVLGGQLSVENMVMILTNQVSAFKDNQDRIRDINQRIQEETQSVQALTQQYQGKESTVEESVSFLEAIEESEQRIQQCALQLESMNRENQEILYILLENLTPTAEGGN